MGAWAILCAGDRCMHPIPSHPRAHAKPLGGIGGGMGRGGDGAVWFGAVRQLGKDVGGTDGTSSTSYAARGDTGVQYLPFTAPFHVLFLAVPPA